MEVYIYHKSGNKYVKRDKDGNFSHVSTKGAATKFEESIARNIIQNQFKLADRPNYSIKPVTEPSVNTVKFTLVEESSFPDDSTDEQMITKSKCLLDSLIALTSLSNDLDYCEKQLSKSMSKYDAIRTDLSHYMEFNTLNVVDGYKAYKMYHDASVKRREIKHAYERLRIFKSYFNQINTKGLETQANNIESKQYTPRIITELFKD